jgi:protein-tyrosine phosphatase
MIDLHSHILPELDDGPATLAQSLQLGRAAEADGIQIIAATPHLREDHPRVRPAELAGRCAQLNEALADAEIALEVVPGGELDVLWVLDATPDDLRLVSFGQRGTDVLLETPYGAIAPSFEAAVERLIELGYRVLLAHPERNRGFQRAPGRLAALVRRGLLIQVTAASVASEDPRSRSRDLSWRLIENGFAHVIASDSHSATAFRPPDLSAAIARLSALKPARARWMVVDAPLAILAGNPLPPMPAD